MEDLVVHMLQMLLTKQVEFSKMETLEYLEVRLLSILINLQEKKVELSMLEFGQKIDPIWQILIRCHWQQIKKILIQKNTNKQEKNIEEVT